MNIVLLPHFWGEPEQAPLVLLHCLRACVGLLACLLGPTTYCKSLRALVLHGYVMRKFKKGLEDIILIAVNCEQSTSPIGNNKDGDYLWTYLLSVRVIEVRVAI